MNIKERAYQIASVNMKNKCSPAELELEAEVMRLRNALKTFIAEHEECEDSDGWMDGTNVLNGSSARCRRSHVHPIHPYRTQRANREGGEEDD